MLFADSDLTTLPESSEYGKVRRRPSVWQHIGYTRMPSESHYDRALICPNGHTFHAMASMRSKDQLATCCNECGEELLSTCEGCGEGIRGEFFVPGVISLGGEYHPPKFCFNCGEPFPWTTRATKAALEFFAEVGTEEQQTEFESDLNEMIRETPRAQVATYRVGKMLRKIPPEVRSMLGQVLVNFISQSAYDGIFGDK